MNKSKVIKSVEKTARVAANNGCIFYSATTFTEDDTNHIISNVPPDEVIKYLEFQIEITKENLKSQSTTAVMEA